MQIELSGIANGTCGDAAAFNDTFVAVSGWNCTENYRNGSHTWQFRDLTGIGCGTPPLDPGIDTVAVTIYCGLHDGIDVLDKIVVTVSSVSIGTVLQYEKNFASADLWAIASLAIPLAYSSGLLDGSSSICRISAL
jgi:hypothetical protein